MNQKTLFEIKKFNTRQNLPHAVFFTNRKQLTNIEATIKDLPKNCAIIVREYDLSDKDREAFARKIIALARPLHIKILIGKNIALAHKLKADGVHFSDLDRLPIKIINQKNFPQHFITSYAAHSLQSVLKAQKRNVDMIFISPIFSTTSHPDTKPIGLLKLSEIALKTKKTSYCQSSLYALGGINSQNISSIRKCNISGFGAISLFVNIDENHSCHFIRRFWHKIVATFSQLKS